MSLQQLRRLEPCAYRLHIDLQTDARFDNPRAVQIRLPASTFSGCGKSAAMCEKCSSSTPRAPVRIASLCGDHYVRELAGAVAGKLGGKVGMAPRIFLKKLVP